MPAPEFLKLRNDLLRAGIVPQRARRLVEELEGHYDDLVEARIAEGDDRAEAERQAGLRLGDLSVVQAAMAAEPGFQSWAARFPRLALVVYPLAWVLALPAVPVLAGARHAADIGRWLTCLLAGGLVTASMFLFLELAITLS